MDHDFFSHVDGSKQLKLYLSNKKLLEQPPQIKRMDGGDHGTPTPDMDRETALQIEFRTKMDSK
jgi:hypothetical protein